MLKPSRILAIINPISGVGSKTRIPGLLADAYNSREEELLITYTKGEGHATRLVKEAIENDIDSIIAVGGDGTINEIASALHGSHVKMGIIPKGSGNGLARALGLPLSSDSEAIRVITEGHTTAIDTGLVDGKPFFCTCGVGFDAEMTKRYAETSRRGLLTYIKAAIDEYIAFRPQQYRITIDGETIETKAFLVTAANIDQYGNNFYIAPDASPSDGLLDLVILRPFDPLLAGHVALQLVTKNIDKNSCVDSYRGANIVIERECDDKAPAQIDGESVLAGNRIEIGVRKQSLLIYTPQSAEK